MLTDIIGIGLVVLAYLWQMLESKRLGGYTEPAHNFYDGMSITQRIITFFTESFVMIGKLIKGKSNTAA